MRLRQVTRLAPRNPTAWETLAETYQMMRRFEDAEGAFRIASEVGDVVLPAALLEVRLARLGEPDDSARALAAAAAVAATDPDRSNSTFLPPLIRVVAGELDGALADLAVLVEVVGGLTRAEIRADPIFEHLREWEDFRALVGS